MKYVIYCIINYWSFYSYLYNSIVFLVYKIGYLFCIYYFFLEILIKKGLKFRYGSYLRVNVFIISIFFFISG